jgi:type II secretory pathway component GspD/PulD (secretin)
MVFIRPTILRNSIEARFETNSKYNYLQNLQNVLAEDPVQLMRGETHPTLPPLPPEPEVNADQEQSSSDGRQP